MGSSLTTKTRPLRIRFDVYGDSDDHEFKHELVSLMAGSIQELKAAAANAWSEKQSDVFKKAAHKAKSTLILLDDHEFLQLVDNFRDSLVEFENEQVIRLSPTLTHFNDFCETIILSLNREAQLIREKL